MAEREQRRRAGILPSACREAEVLLKDYRKNDITIRLVKERLGRLIARR